MGMGMGMGMGTGFVSFAGRVLFASVFILSAYQEFYEYGVDGGPTAKAFRPKYDLFARGLKLPEVKMKYITAVMIALKGLGGLLFIFGSTLGACLLALYVCLLPEKRKPVVCGFFRKSMGVGRFPGESNSHLNYLVFTTPIVYDFYNYDLEKPEFVQLFVKFTQNLALCGALLYFIGMKNSAPTRQPKKKASKTKAV